MALRNNFNKTKRKSEIYSGKIFYSWLLSFLIIFSIPALLSLLLQMNTNKLLKKELYNLEREAVLQMKYICDGEMKTIHQYVGQIAENDNVQIFLDNTIHDKTEQKVNIKKVFDYLRSQKAQESAIQDIYLFSKSNGYMISTKHGGNAQDTVIFQYEKAFGIDKDTFWNMLNKTTSSTLMFQDDTGNNTLYYYRVVVTDDLRNPAGCILVSYQLGEKIFNTDEERIGGILVDNSMFWDVWNSKLHSENVRNILIEALPFTQVLIDGNDYLIVKEKSEIENWTYVYGVRPASFFYHIEQSQKAYLLFLFGSFILCIVAANYLAVRNYNPILSLVESIQQQRFDENVKKDRTFAWLENSYKDMARERYLLENQLEKEKNVIVNNILSRIIKGYYKREIDVEKALEQYQISFIYENYRIVVWSVDDYSKLFFQDNPELEADTLELLHFLIENVGGECLRKVITSVYSVECDNLVVFILNYPGTENEEKMQEALIYQNNQVKKILKDKFGLRLTWFDSKQYNRILNLKVAYMECLTKMENWNNPDVNDILENNKTLEEQNRFLAFLYEENYDNAAKQFIYLVEKYSEKNKEGWKVKLYIYYLLEKMSEILQENIKFSQLFEKEEMKHLLNIPDEDKLKESVINLIDSLSSYGEQEKQGYISRSIQILHFIDTNIYNPDLSIGMIAQEFGITESYVSKLIKKSHDIQILTYINKKRVENVKYLIENTDLNINEIASRSGFYSYRTMIRTFRQQEGITPSDYRRKTGQRKKN